LGGSTRIKRREETRQKGKEKKPLCAQLIESNDALAFKEKKVENKDEGGQFKEKGSSTGLKTE